MEKELSLKIKALVQGAKDVAKLADEVAHLGNEGRKPIPDNTRQLREGARQTQGAVSSLTRELAGLVTAGSILRFAQESVREFAKAESAFRGLEAVANASGVGIGRALQEANRLAADGLISVAEASKALQNLLARGYSIEQAVETLERLKDSAAFNRAAHLSLGEAVVTASEGLKNENSILVDNAGVTKNVAKLWEEYAKAIGVSVNDLTQAQKVEAEHQGILRETAAQLGNAQKALEGYQGQMAQADQETLKFKQKLGELLVPASLRFAEAGVVIVEILKDIVFYVQAYAIRVGEINSKILRLRDAVLSFNFEGLREGWQRDAELADEMIEELKRDLASGELDLAKSLTGDGAAVQALKDTTEEAELSAEEIKKLGKEHEKQIDQRIKDYERLRDGIRDAWQESIQAEKDYLAEAKRLRNEAAAIGTDLPDSASQDEVSAEETRQRLALLNAKYALQNLVDDGASLDDIRAQADVVAELSERYRDLGERIEDDVERSATARRADEALKASKLALAGALEEAAAEEQLRQQDQLKLLADFEATLADLEKQKTINVDAEQAKNTIADLKAQIEGLKDKTVTITVKKIDGANAQNFTGAYDSNGNAIYRDPVQGLAVGGPILGDGPKGVDGRLILAAPGEHMLTADEVDAAGGHAAIYRMRRLLRAGLLPRFDVGGAVGASREMRSALSRLAIPTLPSPAASGASGLHRGTFVLDGQHYQVQAAPDVFDQLTRRSLQVRIRR